MASVIYNLAQQDVPDEIVPVLVKRGLIYKDNESDVYGLETMPGFLDSEVYTEITAGEAWKRLDAAVKELTTTKTYHDALRAFHGLLTDEDTADDAWERNEYMRGGIELICDTFGIPMDERNRVLTDIRNID